MKKRGGRLKSVVTKLSKKCRVLLPEQTHDIACPQNGHWIEQVNEGFRWKNHSHLSMQLPSIKARPTPMAGEDFVATNPKEERRRWSSWEWWRLEHSLPWRASGCTSLWGSRRFHGLWLFTNDIQVFGKTVLKRLPGFILRDVHCPLLLSMLVAKSFVCLELVVMLEHGRVLSWRMMTVAECVELTDIGAQTIAELKDNGRIIWMFGNLWEPQNDCRNHNVCCSCHQQLAVSSLANTCTQCSASESLLLVTMFAVFFIVSSSCKHSHAIHPAPARGFCTDWDSLVLRQRFPIFEIVQRAAPFWIGENTPKLRGVPGVARATWAFYQRWCGNIFGFLVSLSERRNGKRVTRRRQNNAMM